MEKGLARDLSADRNFFNNGTAGSVPVGFSDCAGASILQNNANISSDFNRNSNKYQNKSSTNLYKFNEQQNQHQQNYYFNNSINNKNEVSYTQSYMSNNNSYGLYQNLFENKLKANLGFFNSSQSGTNLDLTHTSSLSKNLSVSSISNGSNDSSSPSKSFFSTTSALNLPHDNSPHDATNENEINSHKEKNSHDNVESSSLTPKKSKSTFPFGKCKVCHDKATGIHYGIATCEGCKGFFKRSTLKKEKYRCYFGNSCLLTPKNRNRCKACRFNKCLEVGMSIQGVKMGRIPKIEKEKALLLLKYNTALGDDQSGVNSTFNQQTDPNEDEDDGGSNQDNNDYEGYDADDGEDEHYHSNLQNINSNSNSNSNSNPEETFYLRDVFASNEAVTEIDDFNTKNVSPQANRINDTTNTSDLTVVQQTAQLVKKHIALSKQNSFSHTSHQLKQSKNFSQSTLEIRNTRNEIETQISLELNHQNEVDLLKNLKISGNKQYESAEEINLSSDSNDPNDPEERSCPALNKYKSEIDIDKSLINYTPGYKHISIYELLKMHKPLRSSTIIPNLYHSKFMSLKTDDSNHIISSLLSDRIYQIYIEHNEKVVKLQERAIRLLYQNVSEYDGHNADIKEVWEGLLESIPQVIKNLISFATQIPGLSELNQADFNLIINNKVFDFFILRNAPLFINDESFLVLPNNIQYTRRWMNQVIGKEMTDDLFCFANRFNQMGFTVKEMALLYPYVLTGFVYEGQFENLNAVTNLNEYYHKALLYELDLNLRNDEFLRNVNSLLLELPRLNELQASRIGPLMPPQNIKSNFILKIKNEFIEH